MKKVLSGFLGLFAVIGLVAGAGYALFSSTVSLNGLVLGTATPGLEASLDGSTYSPSLDLSPVKFSTLLPGDEDWGTFWLRNSSEFDKESLDLNLQGRLTAAGGDWGVLKDAIKMRICIYISTSGHHCDETQSPTPWYTLAEWNTTARNLPGSPMVPSEIGTQYAIELAIPSSYGNEIAGKTITGINMQIVGTQDL